MPIDLDVALGAELEPIEFSWTSSDVQLYHLGLGAGADPMDPKELRYLDRAALPDMFLFPADMAALPSPVNRLFDQVLVRYYEQDWRSIVDS